MKIEKITIKNLTSLAGESVIDFTTEPLRSAGLFAITGNTGSGKSTILDAVCLALYGRAPRFEGMEKRPKEDVEKNEDLAQAIQPGDVRGLMRRGTKEAAAIVDFSTLDGARYEATWSLTLKRTGRYNRPTRKLRCLAPHKEEVPEKEIDDRIVDVIGLDYEQFTRTVMLAQNSFANFLKAKRGEKSALLEKLTGTEIYAAISKKIYDFSKEAETEVQTIAERIRGIEQNRLCPEDLEALQNERGLVEAAIAELEQRLQRVERQTEWFRAFDAATARVTELEAAHAAATKAAAAMRADEERLGRYDAVVDLLPVYQKLQMRRHDIEEIRAAATMLAAKIEEETKRRSDAGERLSIGTESVREAEAALERRRPDISRGHKLTGEIGEAETQMREAERRHADASAELSKRTNALERRRGDMAASARRLEKARQHLKTLAVHQSMFDKFDLVKEKLASLVPVTKKNDEQRRRGEELRQTLEKIRQAVETYERSVREEEDRKTALKSSLHDHQQSNEGLDSSVLQSRSADLRNRLLLLDRAKTLWQRIADGYGEIDAKRAEVNRLVAAHRQLAADVEKAVSEETVCEEVFNRINTTFTLSQSENIRHLRKQLKEGMPCPVCGGTHHPYHSETEREMGELLSNLEKDANDAAAKLQQARQTLSDLRERMAELEGRLASERTNLEEREHRQDADVKEWATCATLDATFADCTPTTNRLVRRQTIDQLTADAQRSAAESQKDLETYNYHQTEINKLNEQIHALEARVNESRERIEGLRTQSAIATNSAEENKLQLEESDNEIAGLYQDLSRLMTLSGWFKDWRSNPTEFRRTLADLYEDWQTTGRDVDELEHGNDLLAQEIKSLEKNRAEADDATAQALNALSSVREALAAKRTELSRIFGDTTPEQEEARLQKAVGTARLAEAAARDAFTTADTALQQSLGNRQTQQERLETTQEECRTLTRDIDIWLSRFNATHPPMQTEELAAIAADTTDRRALRERINAAKEALALAANRLQTGRDDLMALRGAAERPDAEDEAARTAVAAAHEAVTAEIKERREHLYKVSIRLSKHDDSIRQAAEHLERLDAARENAAEWKKLSDLLGSADGHKFRELAQSFTFRFLVDHANSQLRRLSPRYELRNVPGTLTLEIVDRDMFDEHRYVNSLSGGETFVVSLALALGLASLSSNNLSIGSLFIDEGFGNLDAASLDLVMTALSNLENAEGRKVGVISHTEQIRSQISPQIHLIKESTGGRSRIEIR